MVDGCLVVFSQGLGLIIVSMMVLFGMMRLVGWLYLDETAPFDSSDGGDISRHG